MSDDRVGIDGAGFVAEASARVAEALAAAPMRSAHYVEDGQWKLVPIGETSFWTEDSYDHGNWTSGFWVGALLLLERLGAAPQPDLTAALAGATASRALDETTHDIGFMFWPSASLLAERYAAAGDTATVNRWAAVGLAAAETLAKRFREPGGYLQAFGALDDERGIPTSTVDTMMNLPLLWWAADWFDRDDLRQIARRHATTSARDLVRDDGATYHLVHHSPDGGLASRGTFQGAGDDSCWTRGQSWAVHGFIDAYLATGDPLFADRAQECLEFWCAHAPFDQLPPYDLLADTGLFDASAGAILASGLAQACANDGLASRLDAAERLTTVLGTLCDEAMFACPVGIIGHSTYSAPHGWGVDGALPYGDFFFVRAVALARDLGLLAWIPDGADDGTR
jgi:unsaturated chondroitin disaccharide hydrolase